MIWCQVSTLIQIPHYIYLIHYYTADLFFNPTFLSGSVIHEPGVIDLCKFLISPVSHFKSISLGEVVK